MGGCVGGWVCRRVGGWVTILSNLFWIIIDTKYLVLQRRNGFSNSLMFAHRVRAWACAYV